MNPQPLVSCIMPTANRRQFVPAAIAGFLAQDYDGKELIILDSGSEFIGDVLPADPRIRYVRETGLRTLGALRNRACALACGELIAHWDDDDWYPTDRLRRQVAALANGQADVCGTSRIYFLDSARGRAWEYVYADKNRPWVAGATLAYRRELWHCNPFPDIQAGEDTRFVWNSKARRIVDLADPCLWVAAIHAGNTSPKRPTGPLWHVVDPGPVLALVANTAREVPPTGDPHDRTVHPRVPAARLLGLSVVIPHGGRERLPQLAASLGNLAQCDGIDKVIVVELGVHGDESPSGSGSSLAQTAELRQRLPLLLQHIGARSLPDAPCGDFNWMQHVNLGVDHYVGVDIVSALIAHNQERYSSPARQFELRDIMRDLLPAAEVILCRDCLVHFSFMDIRRTLRNFERCGARYLLTTTFPRVGINPDIETGDWRPLNFRQAPFRFPKPLALINEKCTEAEGRYADKSLGLWRLSDVVSEL